MADIERRQPGGDLEASETTPLITNSDHHGASQTSDPRRPSHTSDAGSTSSAARSRRKRWPSMLALGLLCVGVVLIMILGFFVPETIEEYAMQAAHVEPVGLSVEKFTASGVDVRIVADFSMDASRVDKTPVRNLGRFGTWVASKVQSGNTEVEVVLPEYGNLLLGTAQVPSIVVDVRNGHTTRIDFVAPLVPGDLEGIQRIAKDWLDGRLGDLRVLGKASVPISSGMFSFGTQDITKTLLLQGSDIPPLPKYNIKKLEFHNVDRPGKDKAVAADVEVVVQNPYPVDVRLPPLGFQVLADNCLSDQQRIPLAYVASEWLHVKPKTDIDVSLLGVVDRLHPDFTKSCPNSGDSPLDKLVGSYIRGKDTKIYVKGSSSPQGKVPSWIGDMISDISVPVFVPGHSFGQLIKNFSLTDVHFSLPDPLADEGSPDSNPSISAMIKAIVALPEQMNFDLSVHKVRATADVFYKHRKLGELNLREWQTANSTKLEPHDKKPELLIQSQIKRAPLNVTDDDVFTDVVQALLFGGTRVVLDIKADVDVQLETSLGELTVRGVPAEGVVPVKPFGKGLDLHTVKPEVGQLQIIDTSRSSLTIAALVNFTNPTEYSASVPYADVHVWNNGSIIGHATVQTVQFKTGKNTNIPVTFYWDPTSLGGSKSHAQAIELLSQYISGYNTTLTLRTHEQSIPTQPSLGRALSKFSVDLPTPKLIAPPSAAPPSEPSDPKDPDNDDSPSGAAHFISDATMHLLSSTATFVLSSPLRGTALTLTHINATAEYKGDKVGHIDYDEPIEVPPGIPVTTPALPVDWSLGSVGYDAVRHALGGKLKLSASAVVGVRIGRWEERVWFRGGGIGAKVRL